MRSLTRRSFLRTVGPAAALAHVSGHIRPLGVRSAEPTNGTTLYNGIKLPAEWPPKQIASLPRRREELSDAPPSMPPYIAAPPKVIPIDLGRQLFVDNFLIAETTLTRTYHLAEFHPASPVLRPDRPWEGSEAYPRSEGVWYDRADSLFKLWYSAGGASAAVCLATSRDGIAWDKPELDVKRGTNLVLSDKRAAVTVWMDLEDSDPQRRFKMFRSAKGGSVIAGKYGLFHHSSPDGVHWKVEDYRTGPTSDRTTAFYNPFRKVWVYSIRCEPGWPQMYRHRYYWESPRWAGGPTWDLDDPACRPVLWAWADSLDPPDPSTPLQSQSGEYLGTEASQPLRTELYNLDAVAYESLLLGLFTIWHGDPERQVPKGRPKLNSVSVGFSRDGFHWHRPDRRAFYGYSDVKGAWNYGNVQSVGGGCLVVGDKLYFYCSGRSGFENSTGLAILRRDGFASLDAGQGWGTLTTRPVRFSGRHLFVNANAHGGEVRAEVLDEDGTVIPEYSAVTSSRIRGDTTREELRWSESADLRQLAGRVVRFRFHVRRARLYAFWVSANRAGNSGGYLGAGGPGFHGQRDGAET